MILDLWFQENTSWTHPSENWAGPNTFGASHTFSGTIRDISTMPAMDIDVPSAGWNSNYAVFSGFPDGAIHLRFFFVTSHEFINPNSVRIHLECDWIAQVLSDYAEYAAPLPFWRAEFERYYATSISPYQATAIPGFYEPDAGSSVTEVWPISLKVEIVLAYQFSEHLGFPSTLMFQTNGQYGNPEQIATLIRRLGGVSKAKSAAGAVLSGGVLCGCWVIPLRFGEKFLTDNTMFTLSDDNGDVLNAYRLSDRMAFGPGNETTLDFLYVESAGQAVSFGNYTKSFPILTRPGTQIVYFGATVAGSVGQFQLVVWYNGQAHDFTDSLAVSFPAVPENANRIQRDIQRTIGLIGSAGSIVGGIATGNVSGVALGALGLASQVTEPKDMSIGTPESGFQNFFMPVKGADGSNTFQPIYMLGLFARPSSAAQNVKYLGYPSKFVGRDLTIGSVVGANTKFIQGDVELNVPAYYRDGCREMFRRGVYFYANSG